MITRGRSSDSEPASRGVVLGPDGRVVSANEEAPRDPLPTAKRERSRPSVPRRTQNGRKRRPPATSSATPIDRLRLRLDGLSAKMGAIGRRIQEAQFLLLWWKHTGLRQIVGILSTLLLIPAGHFSFASAMNTGIPLMLGDLGVKFEADDWTFSLWGLKGTAHNVRLSNARAPQPVFTAKSVEFNATWSVLLGRVRDQDHRFDEIVIRDGQLSLEQSLTHDWNWKEFLDAVPASRKLAMAAGRYQIDALRTEGLKITYVEHIPGNSGGGVIESTQARLYVEDVSVDIVDLIRAESPDEFPTRLRMKGRSADGIVEISGQGSFFTKQPAPASQPEPAVTARAVVATTTSTGQSIQLASPYFSMRILLDNIGMGAYARMVPTTSVLPTRGNLRGTIDVKRRSVGVECRSSLAADGVRLSPNPHVVLVKSQFERLQRDLSTFTPSDTFDACGRQAGQPRTASAVLAAFNEQTTQGAPQSVRAAVAMDQRTVGNVSVVDAVAADVGAGVAATISGQVSKFAGPSTTRALEQTSSDKSGNAVARGVKGVGSGIKRLFGGGDRKGK